MAVTEACSTIGSRDPLTDREGLVFSLPELALSSDLCWLAHSCPAVNTISALWHRLATSLMCRQGLLSVSPGWQARVSPAQAEVAGGSWVASHHHAPTQRPPPCIQIDTASLEPTPLVRPLFRLKQRPCLPCPFRPGALGGSERPPGMEKREALQ